MPIAHPGRKYVTLSVLIVVDVPANIPSADLCLADLRAAPAIVDEKGMRDVGASARVITWDTQAADERLYPDWIANPRPRGGRS